MNEVKLSIKCLQCSEICYYGVAWDQVLILSHILVDLISLTYNKSLTSVFQQLSVYHLLNIFPCPHNTFQIKVQIHTGIVFKFDLHLSK